LKYYILLLLLFSQLSFADCQQESDRCAAVGNWNFSLSIGAGVVTNPLHGGDNIPLIIIPSISYYGEKIFFENNTLGYTFIDTDHISISAIGQLNHENSYFSRWHPQNIFIESSTSNSVGVANPDVSDGNNIGETDKNTEVNIHDVSDRDWAIDAGIQLNWFIDQTTDAQLKIFHDINNVYNGFHGQLELSRILSIKALPSTLMSFSLGANINSKNLVDYYYGISTKRDPKLNKNYQGKQSTNPYLRFVLKYQVSKNWRVRFHVKRIFLASGTANSPLIKDKHMSTIFAGVAYDF